MKKYGWETKSPLTLIRGKADDPLRFRWHDVHDTDFINSSGSEWVAWAVNRWPANTEASTDDVSEQRDCNIFLRIVNSEGLNHNVIQERWSPAVFRPCKTLFNPLHIKRRHRELRYLCPGGPVSYGYVKPPWMMGLWELIKHLFIFPTDGLILNTDVTCWCRCAVAHVQVVWPQDRSLDPVCQGLILQRTKICGGEPGASHIAEVAETWSCQNKIMCPRKNGYKKMNEKNNYNQELIPQLCMSPSAGIQQSLRFDISSPVSQI